jgi:hypothetical protein
MVPGEGNAKSCAGSCLHAAGKSCLKTLAETPAGRCGEAAAKKKGNLLYSGSEKI